MKQDALINLNIWYTQARLNLINSFGGGQITVECELDDGLARLSFEYFRNKQVLEVNNG